MTPILRNSRTLVKVSGPEARKLLNDVLSGPVPEEDAGGNWWALLSPQGKIQAEGLIGRRGDSYFLDVAADIAEAFLRRMGLYKLRADANINSLEDTHVVGWSEEKPDSALLWHRDKRHAALGYRVICERSGCESWTGEEAAFAEKRTRTGVPEMGPDFDTDSLFPHDIGMDLLGGVDFSKGCYVGQEVVSRMKHRGEARKRPVIVNMDGARKAAKGDTLEAGGKPVGTIGQVSGNNAIGIVRLDRIADPKSVMLNTSPVKLAVPDWAGYAFAADSVSG